MSESFSFKRRKIFTLLSFAVFFLSLLLLGVFLWNKKEEKQKQTTPETFSPLQEDINKSGLNIEEFRGEKMITYRIHGQLTKELFFTNDVLKGEIIIQGDTSNYPILINLGILGSTIQVGEQKDGTTTYKPVKVDDVIGLAGERRKIMVQLSFPLDLSKYDKNSASYEFFEQQQHTYNSIKDVVEKGTVSFNQNNELIITQMAIEE